MDQSRALFLTVPILGDALYGGATTNSAHVSAYANVPEGRLFLHSSSISFWVRTHFFRSSSQRLIVRPEVSARGSSQAFSFGYFRPTSGGLRYDMSGHELEFTSRCHRGWCLHRWTAPPGGRDPGC